MRLSVFTRELHPRHEFRIARTRAHAVCNVFARLEQDGIVGCGEAAPNAFYHETAEGGAGKLGDAATCLSDLEVRSVADLERAWREVWPLVAPSRVAQCAIDLALWDWLGKREDVSAAELAWGAAPRPVPTFCTIGLSTAAELAEKTEELRGFPRIKLKSDAAADLEPVRLVREQCPDAVLAIDANCAWGAVDLHDLARRAGALEVAFLEQPFPPADDARLTRASVGLPVFADESCVTEEDVERVAQRFDGFNIKLVKCGGITPARRMVARGRELGCRLMVGCMLESSVGIAAGAVIAQRTDFADLDGAWLLSDDPFSGWKFERGVLVPPAASGLGVAGGASE